MPLEDVVFVPLAAAQDANDSDMRQMRTYPGLDLPHHVTAPRTMSLPYRELVSSWPLINLVPRYGRLCAHNALDHHGNFLESQAWLLLREPGTGVRTANICQV